MRTPYKLPFWKRVNGLLRKQKITQKELAALVGMKYTTLKFWSCYGYYPDANTACDIAGVLGEPVEFLVKGTRKKRTKKNQRKLQLLKQEQKSAV